MGRSAEVTYPETRSRWAHVIGWGMAVPKHIVTNDDLARSLDTSNAWIFERTGIRQRHVVGTGENTSDLGSRAALAALRRAGIEASEVDALLCATSTPDCLTPATACLVQARLGAAGAFAFDISAGCTGFLVALRMARALIADGTARTVLVVGAETMSRVLDWSNRETCVLFGDGAGALVLRASDQPGGILAQQLNTDGSRAALISIGIGTRQQPADGPIVGQRPYVEMAGRQVFAFASRAMMESVQDLAAELGMRPSELNLVIPHQANLRIIESATRRLDIRPEQVFVNIDRYANTAAASIPIALCEAADSGRLQPGQRALLTGFGAGLTWGAAVVEWTAVEKPRSAAANVELSAPRRLSLELAPC